MSNVTSLSPVSRRGWVSSPDEREQNVPCPTDTFWAIFWRKARWLFLGVLAPEVPMLFACGQWASAKRSIDDMRNLGFDDNQWFLEHAFYADSGGFELQTIEGNSFPITAKQVHYFIRRNIITLPRITNKEIQDKSNAGTFAKTLACFQTTWLIINTIARAVKHLSVTPIELSSVALALTTLTTLWYWLHKPLDIETATPIFTEKSLENIIQTGHCASLVDYTNTPLDFIEPRAYISRKWNSTLLKWILTCGLQTKPIQRIPNDRDPQLSNLYQHLSLALATASFASIHLAGWNFSFETHWETWIWRGNCLVMWVLLAVYGAVEVIACCHENFQSLGMDTMGGYKLRWPVCLWFIVPASLYTVARVALIFEVLYSMRSLPSDAYAEVQWSSLLPHV